MRALLFIAVVAVLASGAVWASGSSENGLALPGAGASEGERSERGSSRGGRAERGRERRRRSSTRPIRRSECPEGLERCRTVTARVLYVESVDPDGDGDLHVVLAGGGISGPGITSVDIRPGLRWKRDPRPGDMVSAAGQVQRGSYGQGQIHASEVHLQRR